MSSTTHTHTHVLAMTWNLQGGEDGLQSTLKKVGKNLGEKKWQSS